MILDWSQVQINYYSCNKAANIHRNISTSGDNTRGDTNTNDPSLHLSKEMQTIEPCITLEPNTNLDVVILDFCCKGYCILILILDSLTLSSFFLPFCVSLPLSSRK